MIQEQAHSSADSMVGLAQVLQGGHARGEQRGADYLLVGKGRIISKFQAFLFSLLILRIFILEGLEQSNDQPPADCGLLCDNENLEHFCTYHIHVTPALNVTLGRPEASFTLTSLYGQQCFFRDRLLTEPILGALISL